MAQDVLDALAELKAEMVQLKATPPSQDMDAVTAAINAAVAKALPERAESNPVAAIAAVNKAAEASFDPDGPAVTMTDLLTQPGVDDEHVKEFRNLNDQVYPIEVLATASGQRGKLSKLRLYRDYQKLGREVRAKALSTTGSATGDELMTEGYSSDVLMQPRAGLRIADLFPAIFPTDETYRWPTVGQIDPAYLASEPTTDTADLVSTRTPATARATFTPKTFAVRVPFSFQFDLLSLGPAAPWINEQIAYSLRDAIGDCILNGDTAGAVAGSHQDAGVTTTNDRRVAWEGLRQLVQAPSTDRTADIDGFAEADIPTLLQLLSPNIYGEVDVSQFRLLVSPRTKAKMYGDTTNWANFQSVDKAGGAALNIQSGAQVAGLSQVYGIPVISSSRISETHASAVADNGQGTDSVVYLVYPQAYRIAYWKQVTLAAVRNEETLQVNLIGHVIADFQPLFAAATIYPCSLGYDVP